MLLTIDSRDRENTTSTATETVRIVLENSIQFKKISLVFMDLPIGEDDTGGSLESSYFMRIAELPANVRGTSYADSAAFILIKNASVGYRSISFENSSYSQTIDLGEYKIFFQN